MNAARLRSPVYALCLSILAIASACGTADVPPKPTGSNVGASGSSGTTGGSGGSSAGGSVVAGTGGSGGAGPSAGGGAGTVSATGGAGGTATTGAGGSGAVLGPAAPLPVVVDDLFTPTGFMGDGAMPGAIVLGNGPTDCTTRAPGTAIGKCSKFTYTPIVASLMGWGGVWWQNSPNNWGMMPGQHIEAGATKVTFYAAGAKGGEVVSFIASGVGMGADPYQDPGKVELGNQVLTTTMTQYSIDLTGLTYV